MSLCREWTLVKTLGNSAEGTPLKCRSWSCDYCQPERAIQLIAIALSGQANTFLTLTCRRDGSRTANEAARALAQAWRMVRQEAERIQKREHQRNASTPNNEQRKPRPGGPSPGRSPVDLGKEKRIEFLAVFEATKLGWPHLHILCRSKWIDYHWLSDQMRKRLNSPMVNVQRITNPAKAAGYVAKYCGKAPHKFGDCKRYWKSKNYCAPYDPFAGLEPTEIPTFEVVPTSPAAWAASREAEGWWTVRDGDVYRAINLRIGTEWWSVCRPLASLATPSARPALICPALERPP